MHGEDKGEVLWLPVPEDQDYPNASSYLSLLGDDDDVGSIVSALRAPPVQHRKAKDDLASGVPAQVADCYHRVCASYYTDENTDIPLKLARLPR
jgi:hypothetical protein